jgi:hypothetical protein
MDTSLLNATNYIPLGEAKGPLRRSLSNSSAWSSLFNVTTQEPNSPSSFREPGAAVDLEATLQNCSTAEMPDWETYNHGYKSSRRSHFCLLILDVRGHAVV